MRQSSFVVYAMPVRQAIGFAVTIVLARLLTPQDYGVIAAAQTLIGFLWIFSSFGLYEAAVQKDSFSDDDADSFFALNVSIGGVLFIASCASAFLLASFFRVDELLAVVPVLSLSIVLTSAGQVHNAILARKQAFRTMVALELAGQVVAAIVAIAMALLGFGYWSLVGLSLAQAGVPSMGAWLATGWRPSSIACATLARLRPSIRFALAVAGGNWINYMSGQVDRVVIGRLFSMADLGLYTRAHQLAMYSNNLVFTGPHRFVTARLSRLQRDMPAYREEFLRLVSIALWASVLFNVALAASALPVVLWLFGPKWAGMADALFYISLGNTAFVPAFAYQWLHLSTGAGRSYVSTNVARLVLTLGGVLVGALWGVIGIAASYAVTTWLFAALSARLCGAEMGGGSLRILRALLVPCSLAACAAIVSVAIFPRDDVSLQALLLRSIVLGAVYFALSAAFNRRVLRAVIDIALMRSLVQSRT